MPNYKGIPRRGASRPPSRSRKTIRTGVQFIPTFQVDDKGVEGDRRSTRPAINRNLKALIETVYEDVVQRDVKPPPKRRLQGPDGNFPWTSISQANAARKTGNFGGGFPYRRSGKIAASWYMNLETEGGGAKSRYHIKFGNSNAKSRYVYGSFREDENWQQFFNWLMGWKNVVGYDAYIWERYIQPGMEEIANSVVPGAVFRAIGKLNKALAETTRSSVFPGTEKQALKGVSSRVANLSFVEKITGDIFKYLPEEIAGDINPQAVK